MNLVTGIAECVNKNPNIFKVGEQVTYTRNLVSDSRVSDSFMENVTPYHIMNKDGIHVECSPEFFHGTFDVLIELHDDQVAINNII